MVELRAPSTRNSPQLRDEHLGCLAAKHIIASKDGTKILSRTNRLCNSAFGFKDEVGSMHSLLELSGRNGNDSVIVAYEPVSWVDHDATALHWNLKFANVFGTAGTCDDGASVNREPAAPNLRAVPNGAVNHYSGESFPECGLRGESSPQRSVTFRMAVNDQNTVFRAF